MTIQAIFLPVFVEVALIFALLGFMARSRMSAMKQGVRASDIALGTEGFPQKTRQISNAYANQFEMPILFILAVMLGYMTREAGYLFVIVEWLFVALRLAHAFVHVTSNDVALRGPLFIGSAFCTAILWLLVALGMLFGIH